jgi:hypothetical protein
MRKYLVGVLVVSLLVFIVAAFQPYPNPSQVLPPSQMLQDASGGRITKIEEGPRYTKVFLQSGNQYSVPTQDDLTVALTATGKPVPPIKHVSEGRTQAIFALVGFAGVAVSLGLLAWDWRRGKRIASAPDTGAAAA